MNYNASTSATDLQGYLIDFNDWNEELAIKIAQSEGIILHKMHWEIIYFVRKFYTEHRIVPQIRTLVNAMNIKYGPKKGNSIYLIQLFPKKSVTQQIAKISGLPKPKNCI